MYNSFLLAEILMMPQHCRYKNVNDEMQIIPSQSAVHLTPQEEMFIDRRCLKEILRFEGQPEQQYVQNLICMLLNHFSISLIVSCNSSCL